MVLHWAFLHQVDFGHDLIFTYGPLGFLWAGYQPSTFALEIVGWSFFTLAFVAGITRICRQFTSEWWIAIPWYLLVIGLAGPIPVDVRLFALCWLLMLVHFYVDDRPITITKTFLTVALAVASLVKFSIALLAVVMVVGVTVDVVRRRRVPWLGIIYVVSVFLMWLAAGQPLSGFGPWVYHSWIIATNFASGESNNQPTETRDVVLFLICATGFLALVVIAHLKGLQKNTPSRIRDGLAITGVTAALFVAFKDGYVRHDGHELTGTTSLALLCLLFSTGVWRALTSGMLRGLIAVVVAASLALTWFSYGEAIGLGLPSKLLTAIAFTPFNVRSAITWAAGRSTAEADMQATYKAIRGEAVIPEIHGTVDDYPWDQGVVFAYGLQYQPRPVFQSYSAFTSKLQQYNADFLQGPRAPDSILFDVKTLDGRYPAEEDGLSWPQLLTRYDPADCSKRLMVLERARTPRGYSLSPIQDIQTSMGDWIDVPQAADPIWVSIDLSRTALGGIRNLLYKPPEIFLETKFKSGQIVPYRLIPEIAAGGFLLSPDVSNRMSFGMLYSKDWKQLLQANELSQIRISLGHENRSSVWVGSNCAIHFSRLHFAHFDITGVPGVSSYVNMLKLTQQMRYKFADGRPSFFFASEGDFGITAPGATQMLFHIPPESKTLRLGFAMMADTYTETVKTDGMEFRALVASVNSDRQAVSTLLWSRTLNPALDAHDRGAQSSEEIPLPTPPPPFLMLETVPGPAHRLSRGLWWNIEFK